MIVTCRDSCKTRCICFYLCYELTMRKYTPACRQLKYTRSHPTRAPLAHYKTMTQIAHAVPLGNGTPGCEQIQDTSTIHTTCAMVRDAGGAQAGGPQRTEHPNPRRGPNEPRRHNTETGARAQRCLCVGHASVTWTSLWSHGLRVRAPSRARRFLPTRSHYTPRVGARLDHIKYQPREQLGSSAAPPDWAPSHHTAPPVEGGRSIEAERHTAIQARPAVRPMTAAFPAMHAQMQDPSMRMLLRCPLRVSSTTTTSALAPSLRAALSLPPPPPGVWALRASSRYSRRVRRSTPVVIAGSI